MRKHSPPFSYLLAPCRTILRLLRPSCASSRLLAPPQEYADLRTDVTMPLTDLLPINVSASRQQQPCATFGIHEDFPILKELYEQGDAAVLANIGPMVKPLHDKMDYLRRAVELPFSLFAHDAQQQSTQTVHAQERDASGVLGRIFSALQALNIKTKGRHNILE